MNDASHNSHRSLEDVHGTVGVPKTKSVFKRILAVAGPAYLVSVGYMDPGNWATDLAAGAKFNYSLVWVLLMSNIMAVLLQSLSSRLGVVRGQDLAQACRQEYGRGVNFVLYILCELAIAACDLAEVIGSAIALQLLFGLPLIWGVIITAADTFLLLFLSHFGIRKLEAFIVSLISVIGVSFLVEIVLARPDWGGVLGGFVPALPGPGALYIAIGILGATVMPHNLYLHSALVQSREIGQSTEEKRDFIKLNTIDSAVALNLAFLVNAAILVMAAAVFFRSGHNEIAEIQDAYRLLEPLLGASIAPVAFAIALLASGQSSTITGTLAGQIVMEGFMNIRIPPWVRRLITRLAAVIPAVLTIIYFGERGTGDLLILSQVVLSLQLPFAVVPLIHFVSDRQQMETLHIGTKTKVVAWLVAAIILALNVWLVAETITEWAAKAGPNAFWVYATVVPMVVALGLLMVYITIKPLLARWGLAAAAGGRHAIHSPADPSRLRAAIDAGPQLETVAIALDFSGREVDTLAETVRLLGPHRPQLHLMHVTESPAARVLGGESADNETEEDLRQLEAYAVELRKQGFDVSVALGRGKRVQELARMVHEAEANLVILGGHGHKFLGDLFFGSTADELRHEVGVSVLVVGHERGA